MTESKRSARRQLGIILLCVFAGILLFMLVFFLHRRTFSRQRWLEEPLYRRYMLADLERRHPLVGMSMEEAAALLGPEDGGQSSFGPGGAACPPENTLVYYVGQDRREEEWFILSFENGVCTGYTVEVT